MFEIVGGSPEHVYSWNNVGGPQPTINEPDSYIQTLTAAHPYPVNGTFVTDYATGRVFLMEGGSPLLVFNWNDVGGPRSTTVMDDHAVQDLSGAHPYPVDGTFLTDYATQQVFEITGGAPMHVYNWANVGGPQVADATDDDAIQQMTTVNPYPVNGTYMTDFATKRVYEVVGGTPLNVTSWAAVGGARVAVSVDDHAVQDLTVAAPFPLNGTYLRGYGSGDEFKADGNRLLRITAAPLPASTPVDDWAILHQLGGAE